MDSRPGRLTGGGIRTLPPNRVAGMLRRIKEHGSGKRRRVESVRYRITGFRDPDTGGWISRNPGNGQYYRIAGPGQRGGAGRHRTPVRPTRDMIRRTDLISFEVEITRQEPRVYYVSSHGLTAING